MTIFSKYSRCFAALFLISLIGSLRGQDIPDALRATDAPANSIWVDSLDLGHAVQGYGTPQAGKSVDKAPLTLNGIVYPHGVGTHAIGRMEIDLHGAATRFQAVVGVDDERKGFGSVTFRVWVDGKKVAETGILHGGDPAHPISVDLTGAQKLMLIVGDGDDGYINDHADWAGALFTLAPGATAKPETVAIESDKPRMKMVTEAATPAIHGARIVGTTPGHPFLFPIAATGAGPLTYSAENLPDGLKLDSKTGIISGTLSKAGSTQVSLTVAGPAGTAKRDLTIVGGDHKLALTPQMGWNSWNVWGNTVTGQKIKDAANEFITAGLIKHGYRYVNIDQGWQGKRDADGNMQSNDQFPDMKGLSDEVHSKGLCIGIYSSPGPETCGPYVGSYQHEDQDAQTYAKWGFDYLKYDWCSYDGVVKGDHSLPSAQKPYRVMAASLDKTNRDIVYSLCQYGMAEVWKWGADPDIHANSWRTHGDILDEWHDPGASPDHICNGGVWDIIQTENGHEKYAGPGHWNDPDMLQVGIVGFGDTHPTRLTPNEQLMHISMWCMFSSPLLIGCDMTRFDPLTLAILTNDEAIDINQDPLGKPAGRVARDENGNEVWSRELFDGTRAVALLNPNLVEQTVTVKWADIGVSGKQPVRDLWLHEDAGAHDDSYSVTVPSHGVVLLKVGTPAK